MENWNDYTVVDLEMTGLAVKEDKIIEIGAVKVRDGQVTETYGMLVNPHKTIPARVQEITGITNEMVEHAMEPEEAIPGLLKFIGEDVIVGQNIIFDYSFLKQWAVNQKMQLELRAYDTLKFARKLLPPEQPKNLEALCTYYEISRENAHRALDDAIETQQIFAKMVDEICALGVDESWGELLKPKLLQYKVKKQTPATKHQVERLKEFRELHHIEAPIEWETLTRSQASRIMDQYYVKFGH